MKELLTKIKNSNILLALIDRYLVQGQEILKNATLHEEIKYALFFFDDLADSFEYEVLQKHWNLIYTTL